MNSEQYLRTLEEFFQGEVTGEALFHALAEALEDPERRYQMRVLEQLERETKELLRENIRPLAGDIEESASARATGIAQAKALAAMPWAKVMHIFEREVRKFVAHFEEVEKAGPAQGRNYSPRLRHTNVPCSRSRSAKTRVLPPTPWARLFPC
ncbi:MAG: hypothetical protein JO121_15535 [Deltaproteobacteria bacterium]|jgi:hypothetical protein|nr:hypothetical protein [Deltaproteobacteria bacterium]